MTIFTYKPNRALLWQLPLIALYGLLFSEVYLRTMGSRWFYRNNLEFTSLPYSFAFAPPEKVDLQEPKNYQVVEGRPLKVISINSDGFRGPEYAGQPVKLLALGGSTTFAEAQGEPMTWLTLTQEAINKKLGKNAVWIANAGRPGLNTIHNWIHLRELAAQMKFDGVILNLGPNDANYFTAHGEMPELTDTTGKSSAPKGMKQNYDLYEAYLEAFPLPAPNKLTSLRRTAPIWYRTYDYQFWREMKLNFIDQGIMMKIDEKLGHSLEAKRRELLKTHTVADLVQTGRDGFEPVVKGIVDEARALGLEVFVVSVPSIGDDTIMKGVNEAQRVVSAQENVPLFDTDEILKSFPVHAPDGLTPEQLAKYQSSKAYIYHDGHHYNNAGSVWLAGTLSDWLIHNSKKIEAISLQH